MQQESEKNKYENGKRVAKNQIFHRRILQFLVWCMIHSQDSQLWTKTLSPTAAEQPQFYERKRVKHLGD